MRKPTSKLDALRSLAESEGYKETMDMLSDLMADRDLLCNAVCMNCGEQDKMEPDQDSGYCHDCGKNEVKHAFILAGIL